MATYLLESTSVDTGLNLDTELTIGANVGDYIEFSGYAGSGNTSDEYRIMGRSSDNGNFLLFRPSDFWFRASGTLNTFTTGYTQPAVEDDFKVKVVRDTATTYELFINDVSLGSQTNEDSMLVNQLLNKNSDGTGGFQGGSYYIEICNDGTGVATHRWINETGTGSTWNDEISGNTATQFGTWPVDDSEWIEYGDTTSITQTDDTPEDGAIQTVTITGVTEGEITEAALGGFDILDRISQTDPTLPFTYVVDVTTLTGDAPPIGVEIDLVVTANGVELTTQVTIQPKPSRLARVLSSTNSTVGGLLDRISDDPTSNKLTTGLGLDLVVGDIIYLDNADSTAVAADGAITSNSTGILTGSVLTANGAGLAYTASQFRITFNPNAS